MKLGEMVELVPVLRLIEARAEIYFPALNFRKKNLEKSSNCAPVHIASDCLVSEAGIYFSFTWQS